jgi:hypothetical protein
MNKKSKKNCRESKFPGPPEQCFGWIFVEENVKEKPLSFMGWTNLPPPPLLPADGRTELSYQYTVPSDGYM